MSIFDPTPQFSGRHTTDFAYLPQEAIYLDAACQTLRPQPVIDAMVEYFHTYNACGGRVKYDWGRKVDEQVAATRQRVLERLGKSSADYVVAFTLNTTYGLNLLLQQLPSRFARIVTSDIEHNSVFLPTQQAARRLGVPRLVMSRSEDGSLVYAPADLAGAVVVVNTVSNIDGRCLVNLDQLTRDTQQRGGIIILDAAQAMSHPDQWPSLAATPFDALCFSSHKLYGPSLGVVVLKRSLLKELTITWLGGGTVEDVSMDGCTLVSSLEDEGSRLEPGLQDFSGIIGLGEALRWLEGYRPEGQPAVTHQTALAQQLYIGLQDIPGVHLINRAPSTIVSFWCEQADAHRLAAYLSAQQIMVRSGYFCCHYYLLHCRSYPPLLRASVGLYTTSDQVTHFTELLRRMLINV